MTARADAPGPHRGRRMPWLVLALLPALLATSCPVEVRVDVEPGPTPADAPRFGFSIDREQLRAIDALTVFECPDRPLYGVEHDSALHRQPVAWSIVREPGAAPGPEPVRITYGRVPPGYREQKVAAPVEAGGCYHARAVSLPDPRVRGRTYGFAVTGAQTFRLLPDGRMILGSPEGTFFDRRPLREINRAAVACARGYRLTRAPADSAAVDAREYVVLDHPLSCGWLRTHWPDVLTRPQTTERTVLAAVALAVGMVGIILSSEESDR